MGSGVNSEHLSGVEPYFRLIEQVVPSDSGTEFSDQGRLVEVKRGDFVETVRTLIPDQAHQIPGAPELYAQLERAASLDGVNGFMVWSSPGDQYWEEVLWLTFVDNGRRSQRNLRLLLDLTAGAHVFRSALGDRPGFRPMTTFLGGSPDRIFSTDHLRFLQDKANGVDPEIGEAPKRSLRVAVRFN